MDPGIEGYSRTRAYSRKEWKQALEDHDREYAANVDEDIDIEDE